jgi:hypothetical protein
MRASTVAFMMTFIIAAGMAAAEKPFQHGGTPHGTEAGRLPLLTFWTDRGLFDAAFPGLPIEDWSGTSVPSGGTEACLPPLNSSTNDACFTAGSVLSGIELDVNVVGGNGGYLVLGTNTAGNVNVLVGPASAEDDLVLSFDPAVRAVGLDVVNVNAPGQAYTVDIIGSAGSLGTATVTDGGEGSFWGVDSTDEGGITRVVFDGGGDVRNSELAALITFGGTPVPVELQSFHIE